jgi:hypothetical protein
MVERDIVGARNFSLANIGPEILLMMVSKCDCHPMKEFKSNGKFHPIM